MCPIAPNALWAMDFQFDTTVDGGTLRLLNIVDEFTRECPAVVDRSIDADKVVATLDRLMLTRGAPAFVRFDNGPCYKSADFARFIASRPELRHVRTRHYAPQTNGVVERFNQSLKYERLSRHEINDGQALVEQVEDFRHEYNALRPHEALDWARPLDRHLKQPSSYALSEPESVRES